MCIRDSTIIFSAFVGDDSAEITKMGQHGDVEIRADNEYDFTLTPGSSTYEYGLDSHFFGIAQGIVTMIGVAVLICSVVAIIGGAFALKREKYALAIVGAVAGIFAIGFCFGAVFALIALFLLLLSSREFRSKGAPDPYDAQ